VARGRPDHAARGTHPARPRHRLEDREPRQPAARTRLVARRSTSRRTRGCSSRANSRRHHRNHCVTRCCARRERRARGFSIRRLAARERRAPHRAVGHRSGAVPPRQLALHARARAAIARPPGPDRTAERGSACARGVPAAGARVARAWRSVRLARRPLRRGSLGEVAAHALVAGGGGRIQRRGARDGGAARDVHGPRISLEHHARCRSGSSDAYRARDRVAVARVRAERRAERGAHRGVAVLQARQRRACERPRPRGLVAVHAAHDRDIRLAAAARAAPRGERALRCSTTRA
jgi:hypothetical protein